MQIKVRVISDRPLSGATPVTFGVALPRGAVSDGMRWQLGSSPVQTRILDRWHDDSARWMLVDAQIVLPQPVHELVLAPMPTASAPGAHAAAATTLNAGEITKGLIVTDKSGVAHRVDVKSVQVEETGALRTVVCVKGWAGIGSANQGLDVTARFHVFTGLRVVRALIALTNPDPARHDGGFWDLGDPGSILVKDISLVLPSATDQETPVLYSVSPGSPPASGGTPFELYQDSSGGDNWRSTNHVNRERRVPTTFQGYRVRTPEGERTGLRATPIVRAGEMGIAVPEFWQNFPQAIEANGNNLIWKLLPAQFSDLHEIQGGEQKTYECYFSIGQARPDLSDLEWCRLPPVVCVDPDWTMSTGAVPFLAPLESRHAALVNQAVDGPNRFELKREVIDEYGWRHFGEIYGDHESARQKDPPIVSHYNNQYDPVAGFIYQFLRTADPRWWRMADELARHVIDIDVYHTSRDKSAYNHGLFWHTYHYGDADTATHRTYPKSAQGRTHGGGPSADHNYTTGLMLHHFLSGAAASRSTAVELGQFVIDLDDGRQTPFRWLDSGPTGRATLSAGYYGPGRGPANSLNALIDAHRLSGDARFLSYAEKILRRVVHPSEDIRRHRLDDPEARWFYTMFMQSLGKYLHVKVERGELDETYGYGRASLLHYARWMTEHEYPYLERPEKVEFPTETWAAQDIRKSDVFHYAALHAGQEEAPKFLERAHFFHDYSIRTLEGMPTRVFARPVIVLTTSGFLNAWRKSNPGATEPAPAAAAEYGQPALFVPQRVRAERRAKLIAIGAALAGIVGLVLFLL